MPQRSHPLSLVDPQELARRNNEAEAEYRVLEAKRRLRRRLKSAGGSSLLRRHAKLLDALDRLEAEHAARPTRAVGFFLRKQR